MSHRPQTIQIFLPDGSPTSIREAELTNRLVKAIEISHNCQMDVVLGLWENGYIVEKQTT